MCVRCEHVQCGGRVRASLVAGSGAAGEWGIGAVMRCSTVSAGRVRAVKVGERGRKGGAR